MCNFLNLCFKVLKTYYNIKNYEKNKWSVSKQWINATRSNATVLFKQTNRHFMLNVQMYCNIMKVFPLSVDIMLLSTIGWLCYHYAIGPPLAITESHAGTSAAEKVSFPEHKKSIWNGNIHIYVLRKYRLV